MHEIPFSFQNMLYPTMQWSSKKKKKNPENQDIRTLLIHFIAILTLKHNAMQCKVQNTGTTPVENQYGEYRTLCPMFWIFLQCNKMNKK